MHHDKGITYFKEEIFGNKLGAKIGGKIGGVR